MEEMFTGIVEATALVLAKDGGTLVLERPVMFDDIKEGSSVAVAGVCLTVRRFNGSSMTFDVVPETWMRTKLGRLNAGDPVNLERAMRADSRLDGHIVQGHVEGRATVIKNYELRIKNSGAELIVDLPPDLSKFVVPKGSIALDGVSLTVAEIEGSRVTIALIPTTLSMTTLGHLKAGDTVNVETDVLTRYALHT